MRSTARCSPRRTTSTTAKLYCSAAGQTLRPAGLLTGERLTPLLDSAGNALMAVWVCNFTEAKSGPHHELQISLFASLNPQPPVLRHPFAIHRLLTLHPNVYMVCHGLWNNTVSVVRYSRIWVWMPSLSASHINHDAGEQRLAFSVSDAATDSRLRKEAWKWLPADRRLFYGT